MENVLGTAVLFQTKTSFFFKRQRVAVRQAPVRIIKMRIRHPVNPNREELISESIHVKGLINPITFTRGENPLAMEDRELRK